MSFAVCVGPKSSLENYGQGFNEVFDPYISSAVEKLVLEDFYVNGEKITSPDGYIKEIHFDNINNDGRSTGHGTIREIEVI